MNACPSQDLFGLPKLAILSLDRLWLLGHVYRDAGTLTAVNLGLLTQSCSVRGMQPILAAIEVTAAQREGCSLA